MRHRVRPSGLSGSYLDVALDVARTKGAPCRYNELELVDIHSHILPGLDDGAESLDQAVSMVRMAAQAGTTDIVASPHANDRYPYDPAIVQEKVRDLNQACEGVIRIHRGCDFHLSFTNIQDALRNPMKYTINGANYILVEFSDFSIPPNISAIFEEMQSAGMIPIVTHPERNPILREDWRCSRSGPPPAVCCK